MFCGQIWDLASHEMVYHSSIIGGSPLLSIASNPSSTHQYRFFIGSADGVVRFFEMRKHEDQGVFCPMIHKMTLQDTESYLEVLIKE